jgi:hypothetical protein
MAINQQIELCVLAGYPRPGFRDRLYAKILSGARSSSDSLEAPRA